MDLLAFFHDRLKVSLRDAGARHDLVDAVITPDSDDLLDITRRVEALSALLGSDDGKNLLAGYKRAANILTAEEMKDGKAYGSAEFVVHEGLPAAELNLRLAIVAVDLQVSQFMEGNKYGQAIWSLATLRAPVDAFFEAVLVNDPDPLIRANRLNLLATLRDTMHRIADFSKVAG